MQANKHKPVMILFSYDFFKMFFGSCKIGALEFQNSSFRGNFDVIKMPLVQVYPLKKKSRDPHIVLMHCTSAWDNF